MLVLRAFATVLLIKLALLVMPFRSVRAIINNRSARLPIYPKTRFSAEKIGWAVAAVNRGLHFKQGDCLPLAMAAESMLARYGYRAEMKIGAARNEEGAFIAHAWVESEGRVIIGNFELDKYTTLESTASPARGKIAG